MRIVSLLPSATEIVYALGLEERLVGVSSDCDYPSEARDKPLVSESSLDIDADSQPSEVDAEVRNRIAAGEPIYRLDRDLVQELQPDLILAQDLCRVCAVPSGHVTEALAVLGCSAEVISLDPHTLDEVVDGISLVGRAAGVPQRADRAAHALRRRVGAVATKCAELRPVASLALEWADPPFTGGHWIPEMIRLAGGRDVLGIERAPSRTSTWAEIGGAAPEVIVFMPCGYGLAAAVDQMRALFDVPEFRSLPAVERDQVWAVDGSAYFSRPGPRLVDGLEILAWVLHPALFAEPPPGRVQRVSM